MKATTKVDIDKIIEENVNRLSNKYNHSHKRVHGLMKLIEGDLKVMRSNEFDCEKKSFYRKVFIITGKKLYTEQQYKLEKGLVSEEYIK